MTLLHDLVLQQSHRLFLDPDALGENLLEQMLLLVSLDPQLTAVAIRCPESVE